MFRKIHFIEVLVVVASAAALFATVASATTLKIKPNPALKDLKVTISTQPTVVYNKTMKVHIKLDNKGKTSIRFVMVDLPWTFDDWNFDGLNNPLKITSSPREPISSDGLHAMVPLVRHGAAVSFTVVVKMPRPDLSKGLSFLCAHAEVTTASRAYSTVGLQPAVYSNRSCAAITGTQGKK